MSSQETYDFLKTVCTDLYITRGDFDEAGSRYPDEKVRTRCTNVSLLDLEQEESEGRPEFGINMFTLF